MRFRAYVKSVIETLQKELNLQHVDIVLGFDAPECSGDNLAVTYADTRYNRATVRVGATLEDYYKEGELSLVDLTLIHEMVHVLTMPVATFGRTHAGPAEMELFVDLIEQQTENLTRILYKNLPKYKVVS